MNDKQTKQYMLTHEELEVIIKPAVEKFLLSYKETHQNEIDENSSTGKDILSIFKMINSHVQEYINDAINSNDNVHVVSQEHVNDNDFTVYSLKYLIDNDIFQIQHLKYGLDSDHVYDYKSFENYYKVFLKKNDQFRD